MDGPLVSVLLPVFNGEDTLPACLASIERQTEARFRCVIVDDGSTDGSRDVARQWVGRDKRFRLLSSSHRGMVTALAMGLADCQGEYVARMDADDVMRKQRLAAQVQALALDAGLAAVGCHVRHFPRSGLSAELLAHEAWLNSMVTPGDVRREAFVQCPVAHPSLMVRRRVLHELGYRDKGWPEDYDLFLRLIHFGHRVGVVPRRLLARRVDAARLSATHERYAHASFSACKAEALARGFLNQQDGYVLLAEDDAGERLQLELLAHGLSPSHRVQRADGKDHGEKNGVRVIKLSELPGVLPRKLVVSLAEPFAREALRARLDALGLAELRDYVFTG